MRRTVIAALAVVPASVLALVAPSAAHAGPATAQVTPDGCFNSRSLSANVYDGSGTLVRSNAVSLSTYFDWSSSGASVRLNSAQYNAVDGHVYQVSLHRWQNTGGTALLGPGGTFGSTVQQWVPATGTGWFTLTSGPNYRLNGYDVNRPAVGFSFTVSPCT